MTAAITAIVLAAGKGTRMKSAQAKVLHPLFFRPMLHHVLAAVAETSVCQQVVVTGHQHEAVNDALSGYAVTLVYQAEQLGTGHAVQVTGPVCEAADDILILCGDTPLLQPETLNLFIQRHLGSNQGVTLLTTSLAEPTGYGRIIVDEKCQVVEVVEHKDCTAAQLAIKEVNAGIYLVKRDFLFQALAQVGTDNSQGEVYLTDIIKIATETGIGVVRYHHQDSIELMGVNSRLELSRAHSVLQARHNHQLMASGVSMYGSETITVDPAAVIKPDTLLGVGSQVLGTSKIGGGCTIGSGVLLRNCQLGDGVEIGANTVLEDCEVSAGTRVAPLTYQQGVSFPCK